MHAVPKLDGLVWPSGYEYVLMYFICSNKGVWANEPVVVYHQHRAAVELALFDMMTKTLTDEIKIEGVIYLKGSSTPSSFKYP